jgi:hypothetical protein
MDAQGGHTVPHRVVPQDLTPGSNDQNVALFTHNPQGAPSVPAKYYLQDADGDRPDIVDDSTEMTVGDLHVDPSRLIPANKQPHTFTGQDVADSKSAQRKDA